MISVQNRYRYIEVLLYLVDGEELRLEDYHR
jgi:hypothetical protein